MTQLTYSVSILWGFALVGCTDSYGSASQRRWSVAQFAGCAKVLQGPRCVLGAQPSLRFWSHAKLTFRAQSGEVTVRASEREGGHFYVVDVPSDVTKLTCRDEAGGLLALPVLRTRDRVRPALELRKRGLLQAALNALVPLEEDADVATRADALSLKARVQLQLGQIREARSAFATSIAAQTQAECRSCMGQDALAAAYIDITHLRDMASARAMLTAVIDWTEHSELGAQRLYTNALLSLHTGDLRAALEGFEQARVAAARLDMPADEAAAREAQATTLVRLGLYEEAATRLRALERTASTPCNRARLLSNLAYTEASALSAWDRPQRLPSNAEPIWQGIAADLQTALALNAATGACPRPLSAKHVLLNLAFIALERGDVSEAIARLGDVRTLGSEPDEQITLRSLALEADAALARSQPEAALEIAERAVQHARDVQFPEHEWRAMLSRARAHKALGRWDAAVRDYAECERLLELEVEQAPLNAGKDTFLGARARSQSEYLQLLFARGQTEEAFTAARKIRRRVLLRVSRSERIARFSATERAAWDRSVADYQRRRDQLESRAKDDWKLASSALRQERQERARLRAELDRDIDRAFADSSAAGGAADLPQFADRELVLLLHDLGGEVLALFHVNGRAVHGRTFALRGEQARAALLRELATALEPELSGIDTLRVIASGSLDDLDVHALQLSQGPLLQRVAVAYTMDLAAGPIREVARTALVIGDARGDLPHARSEASAVRDVLQRNSGESVQLRVGDDADAPGVAAALPNADILHLAGHAEFSKQSWHNTLLLAGGTTLGVGDILALPKTPQLVFLGACEAARASTESPAQSLSIAHAFVAAGTSAVIAATRAVDDKAAAQLASGFYAALFELHGDAVQALRAAELQMQKLECAADWAAFRVIVL